VSRTRVVVIGAGTRGRWAATELLAAGITDIVILDNAPGKAHGWPAALDGLLLPGREVASSLFDDDSHTWELRTTSGEIFHGAVVIATHRPDYVPWLPEFAGRNEFRGASFHAAQWDPEFDPGGKRIAVIGTDATAGHYIGQLTASAASVTVFAHPPRRIVDEMPWSTTRARRWLGRHTRPASRGGRSRPALVKSAISAITASGIRTSDGADHRADAIIYGTGFAVPDQTPDTTLVGAGGLTIRQAWDDGMEPFLGVATHGFPNYFFITGPDLVAQARYVAECVGLMKHTASTRIEVRRSSQQVFNERAHVEPAQPFPVLSAFDLSSGAADDETYDGVATLTIAGACHPVRVRLTGHLDPIDGHYHWQGTVFSSPAQPLPAEALKQAGTVTVTVGERSAPARIIERTPWGTHSVAGVGAPPYGL
jgi:cation diffusion facilitator CzcD-associated flavoprotein CzcO